jgi:hypothetical protein
MSESQRLLLTLAEVLELVPWSRTQLYREMNAGRLAFIQVNNRRLFEPEAVEAFVAGLKDTRSVGRLLELVDDDGRIDVALIPREATLADLAEVQRVLSERKATDAAA